MNTVFFFREIFFIELTDQGISRPGECGHPVEKTVDTGALIYKGLRLPVDKPFPIFSMDFLAHFCYYGLPFTAGGR